MSTEQNTGNDKTADNQNRCKGIEDCWELSDGLSFKLRTLS